MRLVSAGDEVGLRRNNYTIHILPLNKSFIYDGTDGSKAQRDKQSHVAATDEDNAINCNENQIL